MIVTITPRATWIFRIGLLGHGRRRGKYRPPVSTRFAIDRQTLTAKIPMPSTSAFITASITDNMPTAASAAAKA